MSLNFNIKSFIKNYFFIISVALITIIISFYLYVIISDIDYIISKKERDIKFINNRIAALQRSELSPTSENIDLIEKDIKLIRQNLLLLKSFYGNPYMSAMISMLDSLNYAEKAKLDEKDRGLKKVEVLRAFMKRWWSYYNDNKKSDEPITNILYDFLKSEGFTRKESDVAIGNFYSNLQKKTIIKPNYIISTAYLAYSLTGNLNISRIQCKDLIGYSQNNINKALEKAKISIYPIGHVNFFKNISGIPNDDQIIHIVNYLWFYDDIIKRVIKAKIKIIRNYEMLNGLEGEYGKDGIKRIKFKINIIGKLSSIRAFVNSLQESYKNYRIYIIDNISLVDLVDEAQDLLDKHAVIRRPIIRIVIGHNDLVSATITLTYLIYPKPLIDIYR